MVTNYTPDSCKYSIGKLMKSVYLISDEAIKNIRIDNGDAWIESVSQTPIMLDCYSVSLQDEESLDERYEFIHTLKFSVNGYANSEDFQGRYYAIVKDYDGTYWLVNPLFPCKVTYKYTLGYQQNHTDFTLSTASNHPVLRLNNMVDAAAYECDEYFLDGIDALWLNEKKYSVHTGNSIKYTNDGFKEIDYNKGSAIFTESFDGINISHAIEFDILFSYYKSSWHYNLLEFNDNLYAAIIRTINGKYALCGFSFGLQPSFSVSADDTIQETDKIRIVLEDAHNVGDTIEMYDDIAKTRVDTKTYEYTSEYDGYECVEDGVAKYLLQKEVDAFGNETGNYKALVGYENNFPGLNIVGTFSSIATFTNSECSVEPCRLSTSLPDVITFTEVGSKTYTLRSGSNWNITHDNAITVSPESGNANTDYIVTVHNPVTPTDTPWITSMKVHYCNGLEYTTVIRVEQDEDSCFQGGSVYHISANAQTLTIPTNCCIQSIKERTGVDVIINIYNSYITIYVPQNDSGIERTVILLVEFCNGSAGNITIYQSNLFETWVDDHTICIGRAKYMVQYKYTGTSPDHCDTRTDETRTVLIESESHECIYEYRWVLSDKTECDGYDEYYLYQRQVRVIDSLDPWENTSPAEYSINGYGTMERVLMKEKSVSCGWINYAMYRWVDTDDGECYEVKGCEDYEQLNVNVNIRDGVVVNSKNYYDMINVHPQGSPALAIPSDVMEVHKATEITGTTQYTRTHFSGITNTNSCQHPWSDGYYQVLIGCGADAVYVPATVMYRGGTIYSHNHNFVYIINDNLLNYFSGIEYGRDYDRKPIYVPDWIVIDSRREYFTYTVSDNWGYKPAGNPIVYPLSSIPVPVVLTDYKRVDNEDKCISYDRYESYNVTKPNGTTIATNITGELVERHSEYCGWTGAKAVMYYDDGNVVEIACDTGGTVNRSDLMPSGFTSVTINECVTTIANSAFRYENGTLRNATINGSGTSIGDLAFDACVKLSSCTMSGVVSIGGDAFYNCRLRSIDIPDSVISIGNAAFANNYPLTSITIGSGVTSIGGSAFGSCTGLTSISIPSGVTEINEGVFRSCGSLTSITMSDNITSIGQEAFQRCTRLTSIDIPTAVTSIGESAFEHCSGLTSIDIPDSVMTIGKYAFEYCTGMTSCTIGSSVTSIGILAFSDCRSLTSVTVKAIIPPTLGEMAFRRTSQLTIYVPCQAYNSYMSSSGWSGLTIQCMPQYRTTSGETYCSGETGYDKYVDVYSQVSFDEGVTWETTATTPTLLEKQSADCGFVPKLISIYNDDSTHKIACDSNTTLSQSNVRSGDYDYSAMTSAVVGDCVTRIGDWAFLDCTSLTSCTIGSGVTSISYQAFTGCTSLTSIDIPDNVTSIGMYAFYGCSGLTTCTIGSGVTSIGERAFSYCSGLTSVTIPDSLTSLGGAVFYDCTGLTSIVIPDGLTSIGSRTFYNCYSLTSVTIGSGVTTIGESAFDHCTSLTSVTIPDNVTSIGRLAFGNCSSLASCTIGSGVTEIGSTAFWVCSSLTSITIPSGVTSIGNWAFMSCNSLTSVTVEATTPPTLDEKAFDYTNNCPIYVPAASVEAYKTASGWSSYASRIRAVQ